MRSSVRAGMARWAADRARYRQQPMRGNRDGEGRDAPRIATGERCRVSVIMGSATYGLKTERAALVCEILATHVESVCVQCVRCVAVR